MLKGVFCMEKEKALDKKAPALGSIRIADEVVSIIAGLAATEIDGIAGMSGGLVGGMYDPAVNAPGPYVYTVTGTAPCANATATVTVSEQAPADAGTDASVSVCANGAPINLLNSLGGTPAAGRRVGQDRAAHSCTDQPNDGRRSRHYS